MKAEITIEDNEVIRRLANYSDAAKISIEELIAEIIHDAVYGNDIKGSLEDTIKQGLKTCKIEATWQGPYITTEPGIALAGRQFRHVQPDHARDLQERAVTKSDDPSMVLSDFVHSAIRERSEVKAALLKPKSESTSFDREIQSVKDTLVKSIEGIEEAIETGFKNTDGFYPKSASVFDPAEKARELLKATEEAAAESVAASDIMYLSWIEDAVHAIKALPQGHKFVANQFLPKEATPEEARVFGKKLLQAITKHKLFSSKNKGKACMEYVKA